MLKKVKMINKVAKISFLWVEKFYCLKKKAEDDVKTSNKNRKNRMNRGKT